MMKNIIIRLQAFGAILFFSLIVACAEAVPVVTFSQNDLSRILGEVFNERPAPNKKLYVHRNSEGNMLSIVFPSKGEALIFSSRQEHFPVSDMVLDVFRTDNKEPVAQMLEDEGHPMLVVGTFAPIRGFGYDVAPAGQALMISQKNATTLSTLDKPYLTKLSLPGFDGKRPFSRRGDLLLIGSNNSTNKMEARLIGVQQPGKFAEIGQLKLPNVAAGIRVLDYNTGEDELLLGGVDASGAPTFAVYNLTTGQGRTVAPQRAGDTEALFIKNQKIADRLSGRAGAAPNKKGFFEELFGGMSQ